MSLESCRICGHALGIADNSCRHCPTIAASAAPANWFNTKHVLPLIPLTAVLVFLLYRMLVH